MAEIIDFSQYGKSPDLNSMNREQLLSYLETVRGQIARLDAVEPSDMESEEYEAWGERHEELEDLADEIAERLDELGGSHR